MFPKEVGERVVWQSKAGGVAGYNSLAVMGAGLVLFFGGSSLCGLPLMLLSSEEATLGATLMRLASTLVWLLPSVALIGVWGLPRLRPSFFVTDRDLVARKLLGGFERTPLSEIRAAERYVAVYRGRYGPREVVTHRLALLVGNRRVLFGPTKDVDYLLDLLQYGVLSSWIDLSMLPGVDGTPAPAEERSDFFVCSATRTDGFEYGPLFVGPTRIVRFTGELPADVMGRLYTVLGRATGPGEAEQEVGEILKNPTAGHYTELARAATGLSLDGVRLTLTGQDATHSADLSARDADRLRGFLTLSRRAPDGR